MILFEIIAFCGCSQRNSYIISSNYERQLLNFGFEENGSFNITVKTDLKTTMIIFMATFTEMGEKGKKGISFIDLCDDPSLHFTQLNSSYHKNISELTWSGIIPTKKVYYPYILNCNYSYSKYIVTTNFRNVQSHIDTRDNLYPYLYFSLSFIYLFLTVVCIINICKYSVFGIFIPPILALTLSSKSIVMAAYAKIWFDRVSGVSNYDYFGTILFNIGYIFHYTTFFAFPMFVISGWCVYRDFIPFTEILNNIFSSLIFVVGVWSFRFTMNSKEGFLSITIVTVGFASVFRTILNYILITSNLDDLAPRNSQSLQLKINLILHFEAAYISIVTLLGIMLAIGLSLDLWDTMLDLIFESLLLCISLTEMAMFLFRKKFFGEKNNRNFYFNYSEEEIINNTQFRLINEPNTSYLALVRSA